MFEMSEVRYAPVSPPAMAPAIAGPSYGRNPFLRCPIPQVSGTQPDSLRQFYQSGIPQYRIVPPTQYGSRPTQT